VQTEINLVIKSNHRKLHKMHSRGFGIMEGHENCAFNLVVKLFVELGYVFVLSLRLKTASMSSALLSNLLVCSRRRLRHRGKFSNMLCSF
jgi:hypothetical protein